MSSKRCNDLKVILGDHDVTKQEDSQKEQKVCGIQVHPRYNSVFKDVALVELCEPVTFNHAIQPIKFATKGLYISLDRLVTSIFNKFCIHIYYKHNEHMGFLNGVHPLLFIHF